MKSTTQDTVPLGSLGLMEQFTFPGRKTVYRTIDYRPSNANITYGSRWCLNLRTLKAERLKCNKKVSPWNVNIEFSEKTENK